MMVIWKLHEIFSWLQSRGWDMNRLNEVDDRDHELDHLSDNIFPLFDKSSLRRLKITGRRLSNKKAITSTEWNKSLFDDLFNPRILFSNGISRSTASYFWGHRIDGFSLNVPEVGVIAPVSRWRIASQNARHENNGLFSDVNLAKTSNKVLQQVIEFLGDCPRLLSELASSESADVRIAVAENGFAPLRTLFVLAGDANPDVRLAIAENHNAPIAVLQFLTEDSNPYVTARAQRTISRLIQTDVSTSLLARLVRNPKTKRRAMA
jgi:hypothetical protein